MEGQVEAKGPIERGLPTLMVFTDEYGVLQVAANYGVDPIEAAGKLHLASSFMTGIALNSMHERAEFAQEQQEEAYTNEPEQPSGLLIESEQPAGLLVPNKQLILPGT